MNRIKQIINFFIDEFTRLGINIGCYYNGELDSIYCYLRKNQYKRTAILSMSALRQAKDAELLVVEFIGRVAYDFGEIK